MRVTRAFVGSVGAGLCLVAAAVTVLFVLSAIVAVRGWPGIDPEDDVPQVMLAEAGLAGAAGMTPAGDTPLAVAASAGDATPLVLGAPAGAGGDAGGTAAPRRPGARGDGTPGAGGTTTSGTAGGSAPARPASPSASAPAAPSASPPPASALAGAIREAGDQLGGAVDPVAPGTGPPVTQVTDTVAGTVDGTERTAREAHGTADAAGSLLGG